MSPGVPNTRGYFRKFKCQNIWPMGKKVPLENNFNILAWNIHKWSLQREGVTLQVPLFSSRCAFYFPKYPFIFQYFPFIFQKCPFVFQKCLFISQSCPLVWSAVFLFTVPVFFKNAFFQLIILFQEQPFSNWLYFSCSELILALVFFPLGTIYWPTYDVLHLTCVHIQAIILKDFFVDIW